MGTTLTGTTPQDTYDSLIKVTDNGPLSATAKFLSDGEGHDSALALSTARVGVGLNTPTVKLESSGAVKAASISFGAEGGYFLNFGGNAASRSYRIANDSNAFGDFVIQQSTTQVGSTYADRLAISAAGNVGIGTSAPVVLLDLFKASFPVAQISSGTVTGNIGIDTANNFLNLGTDTNHPLVLSTNAVERLRVTNNGLTFNGDTAAANALDDYEEGTFTPTVAGSTTAGTATYVNRVGVYTKIGRQVSLQIDLGWNSGTGTGNLIVTGLPFTDTSNTNPAITIGFLDGITLSASNYALAYIPSLSATVDFIQTPVGGGSVTSVPYDAAGRVILNVTYTA